MCVHDQSLICAPLLVTLWTVTLQVLLPMELSRQENWSELLFPCPGMVPSQGLNPCLLHLLHWQADFFFTARATWEAQKGSESATKNKTWSFTSSESEVAQSYLTLCDPMDCSLPGSSVHGIFQARILEWVAISFSRGSFRPKDRTQVSRIIGRRFII